MSNWQSFLAARMLAAMRSTRLRPSSMGGLYIFAFYSPIVKCVLSPWTDMQRTAKTFEFQGGRLPPQFWFDCTITVDCPACKKRSEEKLVLVAAGADPELIRRKLLTEAFSCQVCHKPFPNAVIIQADVSASCDGRGFTTPLISVLHQTGRADPSVAEATSG